MSELELQPYKDNSFELPYRYGGQDFCNLIGEIPGENRDGCGTIDRYESTCMFAFRISGIPEICYSTSWK